MEEEFVPAVEYGRRGEIVDVDVPVTIERRRDQQARSVVEQDVPGVMQGAEVGDGLRVRGLLFRGHVVEDPADGLLVARLDLEKDAQLGDRTVVLAFLGEVTVGSYLYSDMIFSLSFGFL
jgi:hypothetical protein